MSVIADDTHCSPEVCLTTALSVEPRHSGGFHKIALSPSILAALHRVAYHDPTPIQAALIPEALSGRDVIGQAQTGTGKTAAFAIPILPLSVPVFVTVRVEPGPI